MRISPRKLDPPIVGSSAATADIIAQIAQLSHCDASVLITGESGTGKELVARNLHACGPRRNGPFVAINCAALNVGVMESELFGHGRGSFTGAVSSHAGLFEQANGGTLFLDEIGEVPLFVQAKLLRVVQDREVRRMGSADVRRVDLRIISATNLALEEKIKQAAFRLDLYYRLNVVQIHLAALRERPADIPDLIQHFFESRGLAVPTVPATTRDILFRYHWPGNVRELQNELERIVALYPRAQKILPEMLSERIASGHSDSALDMRLLYDAPLPQAVGYLEENLLRKTLEQTNWNKSESARKLGLSRQGLLKKLRRYGITKSSQNADGTEAS